MNPNQPAPLAAPERPCPGGGPAIVALIGVVTFVALVLTVIWAVA